MFADEPFYHGTLKKIVTTFGTLFNNISIIRRDAAGDEVNRIKIPIAYGPREKYLIRQQDDPDLSRDVAMTFPRMSFEVVSFNYDGVRKLNTIHKRVKATSDPGTVLRQYQPVSYLVNIDLHIISKLMDDGNQIVEQILPFFTPDYIVAIHSIPELDLVDDLAFSLISVQHKDNYDADWSERREILWTLTFQAKALFYGPIKQKPIITKAQTDLLVPQGDPADPAVQAKTPRTIRYTVEPTPNTATYEDPFGYSESIESFSDGKRYNPVTGTDEDVS